MLRVDLKGRLLYKRTLLFHGSVAAGGETTLVSKQLTFPYITEQYRIHFALNTNRTVRVKMFRGHDDEAPATGEDVGHNVFAALGQVDYVVGDDETVVVTDEVDVSERGTYIKLYADNEDAFEHTLHAEVTIWQIMGKYKEEKKKAV